MTLSVVHLRRFSLDFRTIGSPSFPNSTNRWYVLPWRALKEGASASYIQSRGIVVLRGPSNFGFSSKVSHNARDGSVLEMFCMSHPFFWGKFMTCFDHLWPSLTNTQMLWNIRVPGTDSCFIRTHPTQKIRRFFEIWLIDPDRQQFNLQEAQFFLMVKKQHEYEVWSKVCTVYDRVPNISRFPNKKHMTLMTSPWPLNSQDFFRTRRTEHWQFSG